MTLESQQSGQGQKRQHRVWGVLGDGLKASQVSLPHPQYFFLRFPHHNIPRRSYLQVNTQGFADVSPGKGKFKIF